MDLPQSKTYQSDLDAAAAAVVGMERLAGRCVLITGATGTIGSFLSDLLLRFDQTAGAGITVCVAGRDVGRLAERFGAEENRNLRCLAYDMAKPVRFDLDVDYIIHAAGNATPADFNADPVGTIEGNVAGTLRLLDYARGCGAKRFLYVSSGEVYGQGDLSLDAFEETYGGYVDPTSPRSCYPASKRTAETLCASYAAQYGLETIIVRPCHTYGPGFTRRDDRAHTQFFRAALAGEDITLTSAGTQLRSYCYVADCASALLAVLLNGACGEAYNIANPNARVTIAGFARAVAESAGGRVVFVHPTQRDLANRSPIPKQVLSSRKLENLGWRGRYTVPEGVAHTLAILRECREPDRTKLSGRTP